MSRNCFAPGCDSGYRSAIARNKALGKKNPSLFSAPKEVKLLERWQRAIPRKDKIFAPPCKLCELHFDEDCILRVNETKLFDGTVYTYERERPVLKPGSMPTKFPNLPKYFTKETPKRKAPAFRNNRKRYLDDSEMPEHNQMKNDTENCLLEDIEKPNRWWTACKNYGNRHRMQDNDDAENCLLEEDINIVEKPNKWWTFSKNYGDRHRMQDNDVTENRLLEEEIKNVEKPNKWSTLCKNDDDHMQDNDTENRLLEDDIKNIEKPNKLWTVCKNDDGNILCVKLDVDCCCERHVIIYKDFSVRIFLRNKELKLTNESKIHSLQNVSVLLQNVDDLVICKELES